MNIIQITPGAGGMYCGNCFRDNALVAAWRGLGHQPLMIPLYLPMTLDEADQSGAPIFFGGVNVYLDQIMPVFRKAPDWLHRQLDSPRLLKWAGGRTAKTRAEDVGELTISMLRGEAGNQSRELDELITWLKTQPRPDVICLSNAMLLGLARRLKSELRAPIVCSLQGEDTFIDAMPPEPRATVWREMAERGREVDLFIAPSRYYGERMAARLEIPPAKLRVVLNGINLDGYTPAFHPPRPPALGFFARMCRDKGLDLVVEAFILLKQRNRVPELQLRIGGSCGPTDEPFVEELRVRLRSRGLLGDVSFHPNLDRAAKTEFFRSLSVLSVPAMYGEAFGLYLIEALASGVPVVQPRVASFPEIVAATGGGVCFEPMTAQALADAAEPLLADAVKSRALGEVGRKVVLEKFSVTHAASELIEAFQTLPKPSS